jgi:hypothetical protein
MRCTTTSPSRDCDSTSGACSVGSSPRDAMNATQLPSISSRKTAITAATIQPTCDRDGGG